MAITTATAICRCTCSAGAICCWPSCGPGQRGCGGGSVEEVARLVARIRSRWPRMRILLRAELRLRTRGSDGLVRGNGVGIPVRTGEERAVHRRDHSRARACRRKEPPYRPDARAPLQELHVEDAQDLEPAGGVVAKAEWTQGEANPRFVVTSLGRNECKAKYLYEKVYCARGDMEIPSTLWTLTLSMNTTSPFFSVGARHCSV